MAGIYIHIPFCKSRCIYCDFYSSTALTWLDELIKAEIKEIVQRKNEITEPIETIYFGGGTPSLLSDRQLSQLVEAIWANYSLADEVEFTLEINPDDVNREKARFWKEAGINRASIGVQSFDDAVLRFLSRRHSSVQAEHAIETLLAAGISNVGIDLIYGIPGMTDLSWEKSVRIASTLPLKHVSAYHLTYEAGTPLYQMKQQARISEITEEQSIEQYQTLRSILLGAGYEHYEISNFALPGYASKHNSSYWAGKPYVGIGPSAHSYNGQTRRWNVAKLEDYIGNINGVYYETEQLTPIQQFNEYILTRLRTQKGGLLSELKNIDANSFNKWEKQLQSVLKKGLICVENERFYIDPQQWLLADYIISQLIL